MDTVLQAFEQALQTFVAGLKQETASVRTNRPAPQLIENIKVDYAGATLTVKQLGSIGVQAPRDLIVTVWDKGALGAIAKAIEHAGIGLVPSTDGMSIRMQLPSLTDERRAEFVKFVKGMAEKTRIRLRAERDEVMKKIQRAYDEKTISEDQKFKFKERAQKTVDKANGEIETMLANKIKEINE